MKKSLLLIGMLMSSLVFGQNPVLNASFESWTLGEPDEWTTNNAPGFTVPIQQSNNGHTGNSAANGFVTQIGVNTPFPPILNSTDMAGNPHPVTMSYTNMSFFYKLNLTGSGEYFNAGVVIADVSQSGIGAGVQQFFSNANTSLYTQANIPISYIPGGVPAGAIITFTISDTLSGSGLQIGSNFRVDDVNLNFAAAINENTRTNAILAPYPNPAVNYINVPFTIDGGKNYSLYIYDMAGKEIRNVSFTKLPKGTYKEVVDISGFEAGTYIGTLKEDNLIIGTTTFSVSNN